MLASSSIRRAQEREELQLEKQLRKLSLGQQRLTETTAELRNVKKPPPLVRRETAPELMRSINSGEALAARLKVSIQNSKVPTAIQEESEMGRRKRASQNAMKK